MKKIALAAILLNLLACDPHRTKKCEWYVEPEPDHKHTVNQGWVSLCARNYETGRQKCNLAAPIEFAESIFGKKFRFVDLKIDKSKNPNNLQEAKPCE